MAFAFVMKSESEKESEKVGARNKVNILKKGLRMKHIFMRLIKNCLRRVLR